jgi:hypothetical protein
MATESLTSARSVACSPAPVEGTVSGDGLTGVAVGTVVVVLREDVASRAPEFAGDSLAPRSRVAGESVIIVGVLFGERTRRDKDIVYMELIEGS